MFLKMAHRKRTLTHIENVLLAVLSDKDCLLNLSALERFLKMPTQSISKFVNGKRTLAYKYQLVIVEQLQKMGYKF